MTVKQRKQRMSWRRVVVWWWLLVIISSSFFVVPTIGRTVTGDFRLSGLNTEFILASFAISPKNEGTMVVTLKSKKPYIDDRQLRLRLYKDDKWPKFKNAPSCAEKTPNAQLVETVHLEAKNTKGTKFETEIAMKIDAIKDDDQSHYYYFVIDDCSLELYMHDDNVPQVHYTLKVYNGGHHISADQEHLKPLHTGTFILSSIVAVLMGISILMQLVGKNSNVHIAMFWVMAAATCDAGSSFFEILHLLVYAKDGIGSYTLDAVSAHLEAVCDSLVALLLLTVSAGWTLPSDVIPVTQNASPIQKVLGGLRSPFHALIIMSPTAILAISILVLHIILAQWGRIYNDDFDSYHDLEHIPGKLLMLLRIILGICLLICIVQTKTRCPKSIQGFYYKLAFVGTLWFQSLPVVTWVCNTFVPYHLRHVTVAMWGAGLQTSSIFLLSWLVTSHSTSYHKLSHLTQKKDSLTDSLITATNPSTTTTPTKNSSDNKAVTINTSSGNNTNTWKIGKTKVRLD